MNNLRKYLAAGAGLLIVLGVWVILSQGLSARKGGTAATLAPFSPERSEAGVAISDPAFTAAVYLPLTLRNFP